MLSKACNLLAFLRAAPREGEKGFSFSEFFPALDTIEGRKPWIFVPRHERYFAATRPLMSLWLECAASATLGLTPSSKRRIWFVLDELPDLPKVDNLVRLLAEGRKFGAAVILTFQAIGQMRARYGHDIAEAILGCCNTKLFLQLGDKESREWASETIGVSEIEVATESSSLDPKTGEVRRTVGRTRQQRQAVLESELRLAKYQGYLLLPDGFPVAKIVLTDTHIRARGPARQPAYIPADVSETLWGMQQAPNAPETDSLFATPGPV
jgi:type IV secretory pathway TraG/TraD family ATPase VirD4